MLVFPPEIIQLIEHTVLPPAFRESAITPWAEMKGRRGAQLDCFLEGPAFDESGNLYVVDIPFGRVFRITPDRQWNLVARYEGWPNGLKVEADGKLLVADHKLGLVRIDGATGHHSVVLDRAGGQPLLGLNDLTFASDGSLFVTDQGNSGLTDPTGRVLQITRQGETRVILDNGPSPNGVIQRAGEDVLFIAMTRANAVWRVPLLEGKAHRVGIAIQLSGGIGPDGLALDGAGNLLVAHPPIGIWRFDHDGRPLELYVAQDSLPTNLAVRAEGGVDRIYVTDSKNGRILTAELPRRGS
jgi:gluconolactonase